MSYLEEHLEGRLEKRKYLFFNSKGEELTPEELCKEVIRIDIDKGENSFKNSNVEM